MIKYFHDLLIPCISRSWLIMLESRLFAILNLIINVKYLKHEKNEKAKKEQFFSYFLLFFDGYQSYLIKIQRIFIKITGILHLFFILFPQYHVFYPYHNTRLQISFARSSSNTRHKRSNLLFEQSVSMHMQLEKHYPSRSLLQQTRLFHVGTSS